jgi:hypothetical protein
MDKDSESFDNDSAAKIGALFNGVRTTCGSLRGPPYKNHTEMLCIACDNRQLGSKLTTINFSSANFVLVLQIVHSEKTTL